MAIVSQQVALELERTGGQVPIYQPPAPVPVEGRAASGACKWYESGVYTDSNGAVHEALIGCKNNSTLLAGLLGALALGAWFVMGRMKR